MCVIVNRLRQSIWKQCTSFQKTNFEQTNSEISKKKKKKHLQDTVPSLSSVNEL